MVSQQRDQRETTAKTVSGRTRTRTMLEPEADHILLLRSGRDLAGIKLMGTGGNAKAVDTLFSRFLRTVK
jgi:hypothetical protein